MTPPDYRDLETRPITDSNEWQDYVLRSRLRCPAPTNRQQEIDRLLRIVAILSDIPNRDQRHRCLQGFVHSILAPKRAGRKRADGSDEYARRDLKIHLALKKICEEQKNFSLSQAAQVLRMKSRKYGFGPDDNLPGIEGIEEADKRARKLWGYMRKPMPRRSKDERERTDGELAQLITVTRENGARTKLKHASPRKHVSRR